MVKLSLSEVSILLALASEWELYQPEWASSKYNNGYLTAKRRINEIRVPEKVIENLVDKGLIIAKRSVLPEGSYFHLTELGLYLALGETVATDAKNQV